MQIKKFSGILKFMPKKLAQLFEKKLPSLISKIKTFYGNALISVLLFGSGGKGEITTGSDVDLFIVIENSSLSLRRRISEFFENIGDVLTLEVSPDIEPFELPLSPIILTKKEAQNFLPLYLSMLEGCYILYDKENFMKNLLEKVKSLIKKGVIERHCDKGTVFWRIKAHLLEGIEDAKSTDSRLYV